MRVHKASMAGMMDTFSEEQEYADGMVNMAVELMRAEAVFRPSATFKASYIREVLQRDVAVLEDELPNATIDAALQRHRHVRSASIGGPGPRRWRLK